VTRKPFRGSAWLKASELVVEPTAIFVIAETWGLGYAVYRGPRSALCDAWKGTSF
jgi:hypothetical protein